MIDESILSDKQVAVIRQIAREEVSVVTEAVAAEIIGKRLENVPTVSEMTMLFERQQRAIHEFISSSDLYLHRAEKELTGIGDIKKDIGLLTASLNTRNGQLDEMQRDINTLAERVGKQGEGQVDLRGKYDALATALYGDPNRPDGPPALFRVMIENRDQAERRHHELLDALKMQGERLEARIANVESFIERQREWLRRGTAALKFVAANPRWILAIAGGGTGIALVIEWIKALTQ